MTTDPSSIMSTTAREARELIGLWGSEKFAQQLDDVVANPPDGMSAELHLRLVIAAMAAYSKVLIDTTVAETTLSRSQVLLGLEQASLERDAER